MGLVCRLRGPSPGRCRQLSVFGHLKGVTMSPPPGRRLPPCCGPCEACVQLGSRIRGPSMLRWHGRSATPAAAAVAAGAKTAAAGAVAAAGAMAASGAVAVSGLVAVAALAPRALAQPSFRSQSPQPPKASERREVSFTLFFRGPAARFDVNSLQQCNILSDGLVALQSRGQSQSPHTLKVDSPSRFSPPVFF